MAEIFIISLHFVWAALAFLGAQVGAVYYLRRRRRQASPDGSESRRSGDGLFVLHEWGPVARGCVSASTLVLLVVPTLVFVVAFIFGGVTALAEGWPWMDAFEYVLCNIAAVGPLVDLRPTSAFGILVDIVASLWSLLLTATLLGVAAGVNLSTSMTAKVPSTYGGLIRTLFIYVPLCLAGIAVIMGMILAAAETWPPGDGILFMIGSLCGIEDPLTEVAPSSDAGVFFTTLCFVVEMSIAGAIVGLIGAHPLIGYLLILCEGESSDGEATATAGSEGRNGNGPASKASAVPACDQFEDRAQSKILQLEQALKLQRAELEEALAAQRRESERIQQALEDALGLQRKQCETLELKLQEFARRTPALDAQMQPLGVGEQPFDVKEPCLSERSQSDVPISGRQWLDSIGDSAGRDGYEKKSGVALGPRGPRPQFVQGPDRGWLTLV